MNEFQSKVDEFNKDNKLEMGIEQSILDIMSELGELAKEILKLSYYGATQQENVQITRDVIAEFGDVFYSLSSLANRMGVDLERALDFSLEKYKERIEKTGTPGSEGEQQ
jgi:NTP pyrophosphatase (non-canonical NTP hydrolase)